MKTLPLVVANLKKFLRDWKSVFLLIVFPLIIIALVFVSFNTNIQELPVGFVDKTEDFDSQKFRESSSRFADVKEFSSTPDCLSEVREYDVYACAVIDRKNGSEKYSIRVHYDNTKEVVGSRITSNIKAVADEMQLDYSQERASVVLDRVQTLTVRVGELEDDTETAQSDITEQIRQIDAKIVELRNTRNQLRRDLDRMDSDVQDLETDVEEFEDQRQSYYQRTTSRIDAIQALLESVNASESDEEELRRAEEEVDAIESDVEEFNGEVENEIQQVNQMIAQYEEFSANSRGYLREMNRTIDDLEQTRSELKQYRSELQELEDELEAMEKEYSEIASMEPSEVTGTVSVNNRPTYYPEDVSGSLVVLQTMFSTLLLLVSLFVSLLVSMFISLNEINSRAKKRLDVVQGIFLPEYLSVMISSFLIILVPISCVLLLGQYLFNLPVLANFRQVSVILFLLSVSILNIGVGLSYLVEKESITLLIGSFMLVFLIFYSGFVLPIEMMSKTAGAFAAILPGSVALRAFDLAVLYGQPFGDFTSELVALSAWSLFFTAVSLGLKKKKRL